jgi:hypothetical protein
MQAAMVDRQVKARELRKVRSRKRAHAKARRARTEQAHDPKVRQKRYYKKRSVSNVLRKLAEASRRRKLEEEELERLDGIEKSWALLESSPYSPSK